MDYFWFLPVILLLALTLVFFFRRVAGRNTSEPSRLDEARRESRGSEPRP